MIINGQNYIVISEAEINGFTGRKEVCLKKPNGKRKYHVVVYEDGTISGVV